MATVSVTRTTDADAEAVRSRMRDVEAFTLSAGFDEVRVDGDRVEVANEVGPATIELVLELYDDPEWTFAYRQVDGIFEEMTAKYAVTDDGDSTVVEATTEFALDAAIVGLFLDATVIKRQRRRELNAQLDYLE